MTIFKAHGPKVLYFVHLFSNITFLFYGHISEWSWGWSSQILPVKVRTLSWMLWWFWSFFFSVLGKQNYYKAKKKKNDHGTVVLMVYIQSFVVLIDQFSENILLDIFLLLIFAWGPRVHLHCNVLFQKHWWLFCSTSEGIIV